jgi:hypothetical protein
LWLSPWCQLTEYDTPPYDEGAVENVAWAGFLGAGLVFLVLCLVAGVQVMRRDTLDRT